MGGFWLGLRRIIRRGTEPRTELTTGKKTDRPTDSPIIEKNEERTTNPDPPICYTDDLADPIFSPMFYAAMRYCLSTIHPSISPMFFHRHSSSTSSTHRLSSKANTLSLYSPCNNPLFLYYLRSFIQATHSLTQLTSPHSFSPSFLSLRRLLASLHSYGSFVPSSSSTSSIHWSPFVRSFVNKLVNQPTSILQDTESRTRVGVHGLIF